ncbi:MAG: type II toxin-antitoxin system HicA family toxin [Xenococcaceae cyanobacterium MO_188.B29]|nr:type II toxin-antitoxin system HicA family toxin [Xenococcaceae cyanobacterium MO_188.B29]
MPAKAKEIEKVAKKLGFKKTRQKGSHARWQHPDGRATTIPIHGKAEIVRSLLYLFWRISLKFEDLGNRVLIVHNCPLSIVHYPLNNYVLCWFTYS